MKDYVRLSTGVPNSRFDYSVKYSPLSEEVGHGLKGIMVGRISESRTLFYRGHEINMAGFWEEVSINIDHFLPPCF